jgi:hypothetical protein
MPGPRGRHRPSIIDLTSSDTPADGQVWATGRPRRIGGAAGAAGQSSAVGGQLRPLPSERSPLTTPTTVRTTRLLVVASCGASNAHQLIQLGPMRRCLEERLDSQPPCHRWDPSNRFIPTMFRASIHNPRVIDGILPIVSSQQCFDSRPPNPQEERAAVAASKGGSRARA